MGWFSDLFSGGSGAKQKAKMYAKVEKKLGEKITELETYLETANDIRSQKWDTYLNGGGTAEGLILTDYESAVNMWNAEYNSIMMNMNLGLGTLRIRKSEAAQKKAYYEMLARMEEMKENG